MPAKAPSISPTLTDLGSSFRLTLEAENKSPRTIHRLYRGATPL